MKKYKITIEEHQEYGGLGLVVDTGRDYFEPAMDGLVVAHDILEHPVRPHKCGYTDELMAIGGFIAGRVEMGYNSRGYREASIDDVKQDIHSLFTSALNEEGSDNNPFTNIDKCKSSIDFYTMSQLKDKVKEGILNAVAEYTDCEFEGWHIDCYDIDSIVGWICKGYNLFNKRFNNANICDLFANIRSTCDRFLNDSEKDDGFKATLYVEFSSGIVYIKDDNGIEY